MRDAILELLFYCQMLLLADSLIYLRSTSEITPTRMVDGIVTLTSTKGEDSYSLRTASVIRLLNNSLVNKK